MSSESVRDFNTMRDYLVGLGAGNRALSGTVVDIDEGIAFNATFYVDLANDPPVIAQFIPRGGMLALARVAVSPVGEPLGSITRHDQELPARPEDMLGDSNLPDLRSGEAGRRFFESMYHNVLAFEPNPAG